MWKYFSLKYFKPNFDGCHFRFGKIDRFVRDYDGTRYLELFGAEKYDFICNRIRYSIGVKSGVTCFFS